MKTKLLIITVSVIGLAIIIGYFVYFVSGVSAAYEPIKKYEYAGSFRQLMSNIHNYNSIDTNLIVKISDRVGTEKNGYATYVNVYLKSVHNDIEYSIKCEESDPKGSITTIINLVQAYDKIKNTGGYSKEAKGIKALTNKFDVDFLIPLSNKQHIKIISL